MARDYRINEHGMGRVVAARGGTASLRGGMSSSGRWGRSITGPFIHCTAPEDGCLPDELHTEYICTAAQMQEEARKPRSSQSLSRAGPRSIERDRMELPPFQRRSDAHWVASRPVPLKVSISGELETNLEGGDSRTAREGRHHAALRLRSVCRRM